MAEGRPSEGARTFLLVVAGGCAGAVARTATAPLDRIKLLLQVQAVASPEVKRKQYGGVLSAAAKILREEGLLSMWKGNGANTIRIFPYSAAQLAANDQLKRALASPRLFSGACAGMAATILTHPLDTLRLRLAMPDSQYTGLVQAVGTISRSEGPLALYKGLIPTIVAVAPYTAVNFASYDLLKFWAYDQHSRRQNAAWNLGLGAVAGTVAATVCYPLDTVRRRMQMAGCTYHSQAHAFVTIWRTEGASGFFKGWTASTLKIVPANALRLVAYETFKNVLGIRRARTDT